MTKRTVVSPPDQARVIHLPTHAASLREHLILAQWLKEHAHVQPEVLLDPALAQLAPGVSAPGIVLRSIPRYGRRAAPRFSDSAGPVPAFLDWVSSTSGKLVADFFRMRRYLASSLRLSRSLLSTVQPAAVLLTGDRHLGFELPLIKAAQERGVRTIVIPTGHGEPDASAFIRKGLRQYRVGGRRASLAARAVFSRPQLRGQIFDSSHGRLAFYNAGVTMALQSMRMLSANPWVNGGGSADLVAVDGEDTRERYERLGVRRGKIVVTGHQSHDILFEHWNNRDELRRRLLATYFPDGPRPLVILAVPQLAEHGLLPWAEHRAAVDIIVERLAGSGGNLLLSLHPKSAPADYGYLEHRHQCRIAKERLVDILPAADSFVSTFSSTVRWSILCGIPAVVIDFWGFGYHLYEDFGGVLQVRDSDALGTVVRRLISDQAYRSALAGTQRECARRIGPFDGEARRRLSALIPGVDGSA